MDDVRPGKRGRTWATAVVAASLLPVLACSPSAKHTSSPPPTTPATTTQPPATETASPPTSAPTTTPAPVGPPGGPVPHGFRAGSVTYVSANDGWVLGTAPCPRSICTSVVRTRDGGRSWRGIPAPRIALGDHGVTRLRFGSERDGFAYGPKLAATHDGGATWHSVSLPGDVLALEMAHGVAFAVVATCDGVHQCHDGRLYRAAATTDSWTRVAAVADAGPPLLVHGATVRVATSRAETYPESDTSPVYVSPDSGGTWSSEPNPCARFRSLVLTDLTAASGPEVAALCTGEGAAGSSDKAVVVSTDRGQSWQVRDHSFSHGDGGLLAAASPTTYLLATQFAASWLDRSTDGGRTFVTLASPRGDGQPWADLGFTTPAQGVVILDGTLYVTRDAGRTWRRTTFE
jgi:photosystem II stability/assembly factor-like uncharacterized protein